MVNLNPMLLCAVYCAQAGQPLWLRLEPADRVRVLAALAALVILGFALVAFAWWAARLTRRYMNRPPRYGSSNPPQVDDWASKPLFPKEDSSSSRKG